MKAITWTQYGPVKGLVLKDMPEPTPKANEVKVRIRAATVTAGDCEIRTLKLPFLLGIPMRMFFGWKAPKDVILGQEFAGEIVDMGADVQGYHVGDRVFGTTGMKFGAYAQYLCVPARAKDMALTTLPDNINHIQAAGVPIGGLEALHFLRMSKVQAGERVLINGAAGSIGMMAIQLFKDQGCHVTGVDREDKLDAMREIGADHVIDYQTTRFVDQSMDYDVIFDIVGKAPTLPMIRRLRKGGRLLLGNPKIHQMLYAGLHNIFSSKRIGFGTASHRTVDLEHLKSLIQQEQLQIIIDRTYPLASMQEAHTYVEAGNKVGNLVIEVE